MKGHMLRFGSPPPLRRRFGRVGKKAHRSQHTTIRPLGSFLAGGRVACDCRSDPHPRRSRLFHKINNTQGVGKIKGGGAFVSTLIAGRKKGCTGTSQKKDNS